MRRLPLSSMFALCLLTPAVGAEMHWAFQPLQVKTPPTVQHPDAVKNGIDRFIIAKAEDAGLSPSQEAEPRTLIRRATFDLTGLPPSPEEVAAFEQIARLHPESAFESLIERLLASPQYGEQWARHWLDIARYSDTKGYVYAREEKRWVHAWVYRDWVVGAFNSDMPYDRFLKLQIAADQLAPAGSPDLAAMGFLTLGRRFLGVQHDIIDDRIDVVMRGTQALTVACARCHDHKFDPISTRDYYSLYGVFQSSAEALVACSSNVSAEIATLIASNRDLLARRRNEQMARTRERLSDYLDAQASLGKYPPEGFDQIIEATDLNPFIVHRFAGWLSKHHLDAGQFRALPAAERERLLTAPDSPLFVPDEHIANIEMYFPTGVITELWQSQGKLDQKLLQAPDTLRFATILRDRAVPSAPRVFVRGNPLNKAEEVPRQFLPILCGGQSKPFTTGSGRLELASAIAHARNPLTARVMVNRVWQHHFGQGLVATESDFGKRAEAPSHPELLDWLARRFIDSGWSLKALHRLIMSSATYRQSSGPALIAAEREPRASKDADNKLLARATAHRMTFEEAHDAWLAVSGRLESRIGGKPVAVFGRDDRRAIYGMIDRESVPSVLRTFDFANPDLSIAHRSETTVPQQALFGMNHPFVATQAKALVRLVSRGSGDDADRIRRLYECLFQRRASAEEVSAALAFVRQPVKQETLVHTAKDWRYGYGEWDETAGRMKAFLPLPYFAGDAWRGDIAWPNASLGWAQLTATGGHPGNDRKHAVVRRWTAPEDGDYEIESKLVHEPKAGDGIRAFVSHCREGMLRSIELHGSSADIAFASLAFKAGDTLDFIVDINRGLNSDQFLWAPVIKRAASAGSGGDRPALRWDAARDFGNGAPVTGLTNWEQLAQVLMLSNEFMFVD